METAPPPGYTRLHEGGLRPVSVHGAEDVTDSIPSRGHRRAVLDFSPENVEELRYPLGMVRPGLGSHEIAVGRHLVNP